jgi:molecular chaperone DnaK (HSP70)
MSKSKTKVSKELKNSVLGVDLGSALTKISAVDKGVVDIITNEANLRQTPTIVGYGGNERLIGEAASVRIKSNLSNSILAPQRYMAIRCQ